MAKIVKTANELFDELSARIARCDNAIAKHRADVAAAFGAEALDEAALHEGEAKQVAKRRWTLLVRRHQLKGAAFVMAHNARDRDRVVRPDYRLPERVSVASAIEDALARLDRMEDEKRRKASEEVTVGDAVMAVATRDIYEQVTVVRVTDRNEVEVEVRKIAAVLATNSTIDWLHARGRIDALEARAGHYFVGLVDRALAVALGSCDPTQVFVDKSRASSDYVRLACVHASRRLAELLPVMGQRGFEFVYKAAAGMTVKAIAEEWAKREERSPSNATVYIGERIKEALGTLDQHLRPKAEIRAGRDAEAAAALYDNDELKRSRRKDLSDFAIGDRAEREIAERKGLVGLQGMGLDEGTLD